MAGIHRERPGADAITACTGDPAVDLGAGIFVSPGLSNSYLITTDDGRVILNEINTIPGFTPISLFPQMWAASGIDYPRLVSRLVRTAMAKRRGLR